MVSVFCRWARIPESIPRSESFQSALWRHERVLHTLCRCGSSVCTGCPCSCIIDGGLASVDSRALGVSQLSRCRCLALQLCCLHSLGAWLSTSRCFPLRNHCVGMTQALDFSLPRHPVHMQTPTLWHSHWGVCNSELCPTLVMCPESQLVYKAQRKSWDPCLLLIHFHSLKLEEKPPLVKWSQCGKYSKCVLSEPETNLPPGLGPVNQATLTLKSGVC